MNEFGKKIQQLRRDALLSQRALAERVGLNFTYISKIESGEMPPPSEDKIRELATALEGDEDELFMLARRVPTDLAELTFRPAVPQLLRATRDMTDAQVEQVLDWAKKLQDKANQEKK